MQKLAHIKEPTMSWPDWWRATGRPQWDLAEHTRYFRRAWRRGDAPSAHKDPRPARDPRLLYLS